jgi:nucleoid DNA-binding protein
MNKNKLAKELSKRTFLKGQDAKMIVNEVFKIMIEALESEQEVNVPKLGKFYLYQHTPRPVRNPKTNKPMMLPEFKSVKFKTSSGLNSKIKKITRVDDE